MSPDLKSLVSRIGRLVALPDVYYRLEEAICHPHMSLEAVGRIISSDADLTARLLRLANSSFFGFPKKIESIGRAVTMIGTQQLRDLALATTVIKLFKHIPVGSVTMRSFWEHSIACGVTARTIATCRREANIERYYVAGLLHDIGRLVLFLELPKIMKKLIGERKKKDKLLQQLEFEALGYDHAVVGGALLEAWRIPQSLFEPVGAHHDPTQAQRYPVEAAVVHLADVIVHGLRIGTSGERFVPPLDEEAWRRVDIPASALPEIIDRSEEQRRDVVALFLSGGDA